MATVVGVLETNIHQLSDQIKPTKQSKWTFFWDLSRGSRRNGWKPKYARRGYIIVNNYSEVLFVGSN